MPHSPSNTLLTCRYWAFGPSCPNLDKHGINICAFAHWDTGCLASPFAQRGTCRYWSNGNCVHGEKCWYEHRHTGVDGLYQGTVSLVGIDLDIAIAAAKAGFDTWNHAALYDLIWSVKKITLRRDGIRQQRLLGQPLVSLYPDRYRPSGVGDNTGKSRKGVSRRNNNSLVLRILNQSTIDERNTISEESLLVEQKEVQNESLKNRKRQGLHELHIQDQGAERLFSDIDSDNEDYSAVARCKRQKLVESDAFAGKENIPPPPHSEDRTFERRDVTDAVFTQQEDFVLLNANQRLASSSSTRVLSFTRNARTDQLKDNLRMVGGTLQHIIRRIELCFSIMKNTFELNRNILSSDTIITPLRELRNDLEVITESAKKGKLQVDRVDDLVRWPTPA